jgi:tetratricopeptide (TPR) repeat protein
MKSLPNQSTSSISLPLRLAVSIAALVRLASLLFAGGRWWGLDYLALLTVPMSVILTVCALLPLLPWTAHLLDRVVRMLEGPGGTWTVRAVVVVVAAVIVFCPMETFFYGDGALLVPQVYRMTEGLSYQLDIVLNLKSSPVAGVLIYSTIKFIPWLLQGLSLPLPETALFPFKAVSIVCLAAYGIVIMRKRSASESMPMLLVALGLAGTLFFFGYVEFYTPVFVAFAAYMIFAQRFLEGRGGLAPAVAAWIAALLCHYFTLALLPSLIYLIAVWRSNKNGGAKPSGKLILAVSLGAVAAFAAVYFVSGMWHTDSRIVMPLVAITSDAGVYSYTLLSGRHLLDLLNMLLLVAPVPLLYIIISHVRSDKQDMLNSGVSRFYFISTGFFFCFIFFANTSLGLARDWDIAASLGVLIGFHALWIASRKGKQAAKREQMALGTASLLYVIPWLMININPETSAARFEKLVALDADVIYKDYVMSGYEALRKFHAFRGDADKDLEWSKKKVELLDYPQDYRELIGMTLTLKSDTARYFGLYQFMLERLADKAESFRAKGIDRDYSISFQTIDSLAEVMAFYTWIDRADKRYAQLLNRIIDANPKSSRLQVLAGLEAYQRNDFPRAIDEVQKTLDRRFEEPLLYELLGSALAIVGRYSESLQKYEAGIDRFPMDQVLQYNLAKIYLKAGIKYDRAIALLQQCRSVEADPGRAAEIEKLIRAAEKMRDDTNKRMEQTGAAQ